MVERGSIMNNISAEEVKEILHDIINAACLTGPEELFLYCKYSQDRTVPELVVLFAAVYNKRTVQRMEKNVQRKLRLGARVAGVFLPDVAGKRVLTGDPRRVDEYAAEKTDVDFQAEMGKEYQW